MPTLPKEGRKYSKHKDFFDIGAFTGDSAVVLKDFSPNRIFSFERQIGVKISKRKS